MCRGKYFPGKSKLFRKRLRKFQNFSEIRILEEKISNVDYIEFSTFKRIYLFFHKSISAKHE